MASQRFSTSGGIQVTAQETVLEQDSALDDVFHNIDQRKGAIFSSGFDYPGRHSRWDIGFVDPAIEFISRDKNFQVRALNRQGEALLDIIEPALRPLTSLVSLQREKLEICGEIATPARFFTEEERSRQPSVFSVLRPLLQHFHAENTAASHFGLYGAFGYDLIHQFEPIKRRHQRDAHSSDCHLFLPLKLRVVDRKKEIGFEIEYDIETPSGKTSSFPGGGIDFPFHPAEHTAGPECDHQPGEFASKVRKVIEGTRCGDYFEVVLSQSFRAPVRALPTELFQTLARVNPSPYLFFVNFGDEQLIGSSPEIYVRVTGNRYETCPISGTVKRGKTALEDADQVKLLINSDKEESELTMCTDVDRNDMARVCVPGSVRIIGRRQLEFYSHLIHTVDHIEGTLLPEFDSLDAFQTHMWACTVTGSPKPAAIQTIEDLENSPRGWYSGAVGYLSFSGDINTGITLRTAHVKNGMATIRAGATLLYGCDPDREEEETRTKAAAFLSVLARQDTISKSTEPQTSLPQTGKGKNVLLVDHRDSFVHTLGLYFREIGCKVTTVRSGFPEELLDELSPDLVVLSPGPGTPSEFGVPDMVGKLAQRTLPTFGVCLGHQGIGEHFGATLSKLPVPHHGRSSLVSHRNDALFRDIPREFQAGRYHSLFLIPNTVPDCLEIIADCESIDEHGQTFRLPMAIRHRTLPIVGVQFHPESLMTLRGDAGHRLLSNLLSTLLD